MIVALPSQECAYAFFGKTLIYIDVSEKAISQDQDHKTYRLQNPSSRPRRRRRACCLQQRYEFLRIVSVHGLKSHQLHT